MEYFTLIKEFIGGAIMEDEFVKLEDICEELLEISGLKMCCSEDKCQYKNPSIVYHAGNISYHGCCKYNGREDS